MLDNSYGAWIYNMVFYMAKLTAHDYFVIATYFVQLAFILFMFYIGLIDEVKPPIANVLWLILWGLIFAYGVSFIGKAMDSQVKNPPCPYCGQELYLTEYYERKK